MQQFSSLIFIRDNMMLLALNEHLNASLVALATCITAGAYQGMENLWALATGVPPLWGYRGGFDPQNVSLGPRKTQVLSSCFIGSPLLHCHPESNH